MGSGDEEDDKGKNVFYVKGVITTDYEIGNKYIYILYYNTQCTQ